MKLLLFSFVWFLTACSEYTIDDSPGLFHLSPSVAGSAGHGAGSSGDGGSAGASVYQAGTTSAAGSGSAGAQGGSGSLGGSGQAGIAGTGGAPQGGQPSAGNGGAESGAAGEPSAGAPNGGQGGAAGSVDLAGSAGVPSGGSPGGQGGSSSGAGGTAQDYFQGCPGNGTPGAPLWQPDWDGASSATAEYIAGIPLHGQVQAACGVFSTAFWPQYDRCLWICRDPALCKLYPPDGSVHQSLNSENAWGGRGYCDCYKPDTGASCASVPH